MNSKRYRFPHTLAGWVIGFGLIAGLGLANETSATPTQSTVVPEAGFRSLLKITKTWHLSCKEWRGTLDKKIRLAGWPVLQQTEIKLHVFRQLAYAMPGACKKNPVSCQQCDRCSVACIDGKPWALNVVETRIKTITLAESITVQGFPFKKGTRLTFRKNGSLQAAELQSPQTLASRKLQKQVHLNKGTSIAFIPAPDKKVWKVPKIKLFRIGKFECYYTGDDLAVVCSF